MKLIIICPDHSISGIVYYSKTNKLVSKQQMITIPCANITLDGIDISPIYPKKNKYHNSPYNAPLVNVLPTKKPGHIVPIGQPLPPEGPLQTFQSNANTGHIVKGTDGSILESSVVDRRNKNGKKYIQDSRIKFETEEKLFTANAYKAPDHVVTKGMDKKIIDKVLRSKLKSGETFWVKISISTLMTYRNLNRNWNF